jgi:Major Facilitator Superfamily
VSPRENRAALIVAVLLGLGAAWNGGNIGPVVSTLSNDFGVSLAAIGLLSGTVFFVAGVVGTVASQPIGERIGVANGMRLACLLMGAGNVLFALGLGFAGLAVGRVLAGLGFAIAAVLGPVFARTVGGVRLAGAFGAGFQLGVAAALVIGSLLEDAGVAWQVGFVISAVIGMSAFPFIPREVQVDPPGSPQGGFLRAAFRSFELVRLTAMFVATLGVPLILGAWLIHYLTTTGGIAVGVAGILSFVLYGLSAAMRLTGARIMARGGSAVVLAGLVPLLAAAGLAAIAIDAGFAVALPAVIAMGIGFALPYAVIIVESQRLFPAEPLAPLAFVMVWTQAIPIVVIPLIGSALAAGDGEIAFLALGAFVAVACALNLKPADVPIGGG